MNLRCLFACAILTVLFATVGGRAAAIPPAGFEWTRAEPAAKGFDPARLDALRDDLAVRRTKAFLVIRDDAIVYEWYAPDHGEAKRHYTASLAKAVVGGLSLAAAMDRVHLDLDEPVAKFVPQWRDDPRKAKITLRHLGSHTSGISDADNSKNANPPPPAWEIDFWKRGPVPRDPFTLARDAAPLVSAPGAEFHYSNPGIAMLTYVVTAALRPAAEKDIRSLLRARVMRPIGAADNEWTCGYGQTFEVDGLPLVGSWGGGDYTARTLARIGRLMLREGNWEGVPVLTPEAVRATTRDSGLPGAVNCGWWTNARGRIAALPRDAFWGSGAGNQTLLVVPSLRLIMVRNGQGLASGNENNDTALDKFLLTPLVGTLRAP